MATIIVRDQRRIEVEKSSEGQVTVMYDQVGYPSYMMVIPRFRCEEVSTAFGKGVCPAFVVDGVEKSEIFIGLSRAVVKNGIAMSIPGVAPTTCVNFDEALLACKRKGPGWHLTSNAEWAALTMWCMKHGWLYEDLKCGMQGLFSFGWDGVGGLRLMDGEIQVLPNNDAACNALDQGEESGLWKSISQNGDFASPGSDGVFFYHVDEDSRPRLGLGKSERDAYGYCRFRGLEAEACVAVPDILRQLLLFPQSFDGAVNVSGGFWAGTQGETVPFRGGYWDGGAHAGLFALYLDSARSNTGSSIGVRPAFVS